MTSFECNFINIRRPVELIMNNAMSCIPLNLESRNRTSFCEGPGLTFLPQAGLQINVCASFSDVALRVSAVTCCYSFLTPNIVVVWLVGLPFLIGTRNILMVLNACKSVQW